MVNRCHSSYVHYNQIMQDHYSNHYHCGGGCGSIFTSHHHCGGFGSGFWGGVGAGLGLGVSNLLMTGVSMLGNWLLGGSGFGCFGNYGMNFGNWGSSFGNYGFGNTGFWGLNGTGGKTKKEKTDKTSSSDDDKKTKVVEKVVEKEVEKTNADAKKIADLQTKLATMLDKINNNQSVTQTEIDNLLNEINNIKEDSLDGIQDDVDKQNLESLKKSLPELKPTIESNLAEILTKETPSEDDIRSLIINFATLTDAQKAELKTKAEDKVKDLKNDDGSYKPAKNNYSQWLYLELLGKLDSSLVVNMETRSASSDTWIKGRPYNVQKDAKGNITYWIDCSKTGDEIKAAWKFVTINENTVEIKGTEATEETQKEYNARIGMEYEWNEDLGCYVNNNGKATAN